MAGKRISVIEQIKFSNELHTEYSNTTPNPDGLISTVFFLENVPYDIPDDYMLV